MSMQVIFSIIIPVYNVAPYLRECLDSVLMQSFSNWEAICVDDGSTDGSGGILDEYAKRDVRFRVIHQKNAGVSSARNVGMENIRGKFFLFIDADDVIALWSLELLNEMFRSLRCDGVVANVKWHKFQSCSELKGLQAKFGELYEKKAFSFNEVENRFDLLCDYNSAIGCVCGRVFATKIFAGFRFIPDVTIMEDMRFWVNALAKDAKWGEFNLPYYYYRNRVGSASHSMTLFGFCDVLMGHRYVAAILNESAKISKRQWKAYWHTYRPFLLISWRNIVFNWSKLLSQQRKDVFDSMGLLRDTSYLSLPISYYFIGNMPILGRFQLCCKFMSALDRYIYSIEWRVRKWMKKMFR